MLDAVVLVGKNPPLQHRTLGQFVQTAFFEDQDAHQRFPMARSAHTCVRRCPQGLNYQHNILSSIRTWKERTESWSPWALEAHRKTMIPRKSFPWKVNRPLKSKEGNVTSSRCVSLLTITVGDWSLLVLGASGSQCPTHKAITYPTPPYPHFPLGIDGGLLLCDKPRARAAGIWKWEDSKNQCLKW